MFNNIINIHDVSKFCNKIKRGHIKLIFSKLIGNKQKKIKKAWGHTLCPQKNWWNIPAVKKRWNYLISGNNKVDYIEYISRKYLGESLCALSLGCGTGHNELRWAELGKFKNIDAYDLSEPRIEYARNNANEKGYGNIINYCIGNIYTLEIRAGYYDVILVEHSLHHFFPLNEILRKIDSFLKPNGYFIVNEFVGPTRFQWTKRQLEVVNGLLSILPVKYRNLWNSSSIKSKVFRPSRLSMILSDPSEAIESSRIMPLLHEMFNVRNMSMKIRHIFK